VLITSKALLLIWRLAAWVCVPGDKRTMGGTLSQVRLAAECGPPGDRHHKNGSV